MIAFLDKATRGSLAITKRSCLVNQRCLKKFYNKVKALPVLNIRYNKLLRHYSVFLHQCDKAVAIYGCIFG